MVLQVYFYSVYMWIIAQVELCKYELKYTWIVNLVYIVLCTYIYIQTSLQ